MHSRAARQRRLGQAASTSAARVGLAREFVDFFEKHVPIIATALASMFGAVAMLLTIEPMVGAACVVALLGALRVLPSFARRNEQYLWTFVGSLDDVPSMVDQLARLEDIGRRVSPGMEDAERREAA